MKGAANTMAADRTVQVEGPGRLGCPDRLQILRRLVHEQRIPKYPCCVDHSAQWCSLGVNILDQAVYRRLVAHVASCYLYDRRVGLHEAVRRA